MALALTRGLQSIRLPSLRYLYSLIARSDLSEAAPRMRLIDIGANLLDTMYQGEYNDKHYHAPDLEAVLERSWRAGVSPGAGASAGATTGSRRGVSALTDSFV